MRPFAPLLLGLLAFALTGLPAPAQQERPQAGDFRASCRPPLKFMAGACVPQCYAGYEDRGYWCEERRGGGGGGGP